MILIVVLIINSINIMENKVDGVECDVPAANTQAVYSKRNVF